MMLRELDQPKDGFPGRDAGWLQQTAAAARGKLAEYEKRLKDTGKYGLKPEKSHDEPRGPRDCLRL